MTVYLITGGNLGDRLSSLETAKHHISVKIGEIIGFSSIYESEPWGFISDQLFLNQVIAVKTGLGPFQVLDKIKKIETLMGRIRTGQGYTERIIDIDILFYGEEIINNESLIIPHQHIQDRMFVLMPMNEIAPNYFHPILKKSIFELMAECKDNLKVHKYS